MKKIYNSFLAHLFFTLFFSFVYLVLDDGNFKKFSDAESDLHYIFKFINNNSGWCGYKFFNSKFNYFRIYYDFTTINIDGFKYNHLLVF